MKPLVLFILLAMMPGLNSWVPSSVFADAPGGTDNETVGGVPAEVAGTAALSEAAVIEKMAEEIRSHSWAESFLFVVVDIGIITISLGLLLSFYRIIRGPQLPDRVLAGDTFSFHVVGLVILLAIRLRTEVFFDAALVVAIIGFASTLAFAQYIGNRRKRTVAP